MHRGWGLLCVKGETSFHGTYLMSPFIFKISAFNNWFLQSPSIPPLDLPKSSCGPSQASDSCQMIKLRHRSTSKLLLLQFSNFKLFILPHWLIGNGIQFQKHCFICPYRGYLGTVEESKSREISKQYLSAMFQPVVGPQQKPLFLSPIIPSTILDHQSTNIPIKIPQEVKVPCLLLCFTSAF